MIRIKIHSKTEDSDMKTSPLSDTRFPTCQNIPA